MLSRGFEWIIFLDSDAFFQDARLSLPLLLSRYGGADATEPLQFGWDSPYTLGPNAGFAMFQRTEATMEMLRVWWNMYSGVHSIEHPFEQYVLQWHLVHLHDCTPCVKVN